MVQIALDLDMPGCSWPFESGCDRPATRTLDTGRAVVGSCDWHQHSNWWGGVVWSADRALAEARRGWMKPPDAAGEGE